MSEVANKSLVEEFYPDSYSVPSEGGYLIRGTYNGLRFNRLHHSPEPSVAEAYKAVVDRMNLEANHE
jgi:hypothetical protein